MLDKIKTLKKEIEQVSAATFEEVEKLRIKYIGKKGVINQLFASFKNVPANEKKEVGQALNEIKNLAAEKINILRETFQAIGKRSLETDLTMPGEPLTLGTRHPIAIVKNKIVNIFGR